MTNSETVVLTLLDKVRLGLVDSIAIVFIEGDNIRVQVSCEEEQKVILLNGLGRAIKQIIEEI